MSIAEPQNSATVPPRNIDAEQSLLGAIFVNNRVLDQVAPIVRGADFHFPVHGRIFETCLDMHRRGEEANPVTLKHMFEDDPGLEEAGGAAYLGRVAGSAITVINAANYARAVADLAIRRGVLEVESDLQHEVASLRLDHDAHAAIEKARTRLDELLERLVASGSTGNGEVEHAADAAIARVEKAYQAGGALLGLTTGITRLDRELSGLQAPDLVVLAGRPGMGKTAMALTMARAAATAGARVSIASLEMSEEQLAARLLSMMTGIAAERLRRGEVANEHFILLRDARNRLAAMPIRIDDTAGVTVEDIEAKAMAQARGGLDLLIVDHIGLIRAPQSLKNANRVQHITHITARLKEMAKRIEAPVLALSQLSRAPQHRDNKRPILDDLRDSGSIEQDADVVLFLYRDAYYLQRAEPSQHEVEKYATWQDEMAKAQHDAEVIIGKNRHGRTWTVRARWEPETMSFGDEA